MDSDKRSRVGVIFRVPLALRDQLQQRLDSSPATSMNSYLEQLVLSDLLTPSAAPFAVHTSPTFAANGRKGRGRPTKGPRAAILLRLDPAVRQHMRQRAAALGLPLNDYLDSLVSQDISAASMNPREEMVLDQSA